MSGRAAASANLSPLRGTASRGSRGPVMTLSRFLRFASLALFLFCVSAFLHAEDICEEGNGPVKPDQPKGITTQQIIDKFAAREGVFKEARNNYTFTQDVTVQEFDGSSVGGEYRLVQDITYDDKGNRIENVTFAPQSSLRQISMTREDF